MSENNDDNFDFKATGFDSKFSFYLRTLFENKHNCDSSIFGENENEKVRVHRLIMDATIPGLVPLTNSQRAIEIDDRNARFVYKLPLTIETITKTVKFCYTGEISMAKDEVVPLLKFAIDNNVKELSDACLNRLKQSIDPDSFKQVVERLNSANDVSEQRIWREIICFNFAEVSKYPTFGDITMEQFVNMIRSPNLRNIREEDVFTAFLLWLEKPNNVSAHLDIGSMLTHIRFPLMNLMFFTENVESILEQFNRNDLILEYYKSNHPESKLINMKNERMSRRENDLVVLNLKRNNKLFTQIVPHQSDKRVKSREIPHEFQYNRFQNITIANGKLFISGGEDEHNNKLSTVTDLNLETFEIMEYPALQTPRSSHALIVFNNDIYVAGGSSNAGILNTVEKYSHNDKKWIFHRTMFEEKRDLFLVAVNGYIYALGGRNLDNELMLNSVERYDPSLNYWIPVATMIYPRACLSAVARNNSIYVFGGAQKITGEGENSCFSNYTDKVEQYDIATDSWSTIYTLDTALIDIASCLYGEYIILAGGFVEEKREEVKRIQIFDTDRLECSYMNSLEEGVSRGVAFSAPMDFIEKLTEHQIGTNT